MLLAGQVSQCLVTDILQYPPGPMLACMLCPGMGVAAGVHDTKLAHGVALTNRACMQAIRKKLPPPENTLSQPGPNQAPASGQQQGYLAPEDYVAQDEIFKVGLQPALSRRTLTGHCSGSLGLQASALLQSQRAEPCQLLGLLLLEAQHVWARRLSVTSSTSCSALSAAHVGACQVRIAALRREEDGLGRERDRLEAEKMRHIRRGLSCSSPARLKL